jgi:polysaccharide biosynthesis/export protein
MALNLCAMGIGKKRASPSIFDQGPQRGAVAAMTPFVSFARHSLVFYNKNTLDTLESKKGIRIVILHRIVALAACASLAGCSLPRSAGFQTEVLAAARTNIAAEGEAPAYDFVVFEVDRTTMPTLQTWPDRGATALPWLDTAAQPASLLIAPGDVVQVTVWDAEENSFFTGAGQRVTPLQQTEVSASGQIFVPYIGELTVSGMSPDVARATIEQELMRTIPSVQVQLVVEPGRANSANLVSGVGAVGLVPLPNRNIRLLELLSQAGGANPTFVNPQVRVTRAGRTYGIALQRLLDDPALDPPVRGGDRIMVVPEERQFLAMGATGSTAIFDFPEGDLSALEAIATIGGVSGATANPKGILIMREYDPAEVGDGISAPPQERVVFTMDTTTADGLFSARRFKMQDGDLIYATESAIVPALALFGLVNSVRNSVNN